MTRLPRFRPFTTRLLAWLAALALLTAQPLAAAHAVGDCDVAHHGHDARAEVAAHASHDHGTEAADAADDEASESTCALCVFNASASEWALLPAGATMALRLPPRADPPAAPPAARLPGSRPAQVPARGPPANLLRA
jgi:hypothetical protein